MKESIDIESYATYILYVETQPLFFKRRSRNDKLLRLQLDDIKKRLLTNESIEEINQKYSEVEYTERINKDVAVKDILKSKINKIIKDIQKDNHLNDKENKFSLPLLIALNLIVFPYIFFGVPLLFNGAFRAFVLAFGSISIPLSTSYLDYYSRIRIDNLNLIKQIISSI